MEEEVVVLRSYRAMVLNIQGSITAYDHPANRAIPGATAATISNSTVSFGDSGDYSVAVTDDLGTNKKSFFVGVASAVTPSAGRAKPVGALTHLPVRPKQPPSAHFADEVFAGGAEGLIGAAGFGSVTVKIPLLDTVLV